MVESKTLFIILVLVCTTIVLYCICISFGESAQNLKFASETAADSCPGVERLNWLNDTTLIESVVYTNVCAFPSERVMKEGCVDWTKTREKFMEKCKQLQQEEITNA